MDDRSIRYCEDVLSGKIKTGNMVKLSCKRHIEDLKRQGTEEFPYVWDAEKAEEIVQFSEILILAEGEGNELLKLEPFQSFIFQSLFAWVHKDTGYRRFRTSYIQLGRQNGKSMMNGILAIKCSNFDNYNYGQIYCTATKSEQAKIVFKEIVKFVNADKELSEIFRIKEYESTIEALLTNSVIRALGRDTKSIDGFRPYLGIVDEYHAHKDNQMYKLLEGGTGKLAQSLISVITTAGFDLNGPCYELYDYCCKLLELGGHDNETQFVYITTLDKDDDIWDPKNWVKANPLTCSKQEGINRMLDIANKAKQMGGSELRDFMTKRLNIWVKFTDSQYMNVENWKKCESETTLEDMRGKSCYLGLDLSSGGDLTSGGLEFPLIVDNEQKYYDHSHSFIPAQRVAEHIKTDKAPYDMWIRDDLLTVTETLGGVKTDYKYIIAYYKKLIADYELKLLGIAYDPHNADAFLGDLEEFGVDCVEITQSARSLNDATVDYKLEVDANNVIYNKHNKLLTWSVVNAVTVSNSFGEIKIDKDLRVKRIDPVDAIINAHKLAILNKPNFDASKYVTDEYLDKWWGLNED